MRPKPLRPVCIRHKDFSAVRNLGVVSVADNGSSDGSVQLARQSGARVVCIAHKGYATTCLAVFGRHTGDSSLWATLTTAMTFGNFIFSSRDWAPKTTSLWGIGSVAGFALEQCGLHRYLGNPVLSFAGRVLFSSGVGDFHCGLRGVNRAALLQLGLTSPGMEFASEMVVRATLAGWRIAEIPTTLAPAGRSPLLICERGATAGGTCASC